MNESPDLLDKVFKLVVNAAMNVEYYRILEWRWGLADLVGKILVGVLMFVGICAAANKPKLFGKHGFMIAVCSGFLAALLLIIPADKWTQNYHDLAQEWSSIRQQLEQIDSEVEKGGYSREHIDAELKAINDRKRAMNEPGPWRNLLIRCQGDQLERIYGQGIRTKEQVDALQKQAVPEETAAAAN